MSRFPHEGRLQAEHMRIVLVRNSAHGLAWKLISGMEKEESKISPTEFMFQYKSENNCLGDR